jgi:hypothetical protein
MQVYFFECAGEDALSKLGKLQQQLETLSFISETRLLKNTKQSNLYLLVVETSEEPHITPPEGAKVWSFETINQE